VVALLCLTATLYDVWLKLSVTEVSAAKLVMVNDKDEKEQSEYSPLIASKKVETGEFRVILTETFSNTSLAW